MLVYHAAAMHRVDCGLQLGDGLYREVILTISVDGSLRLNNDPVDWTGLQEQLGDIYRTRSEAERILFLMNESGKVDARERAVKVATRAGIKKLCVLDPANPLKLPLVPGAG
jgi:hypothetical protein